jgi:hypothetical protein
MTRKLTQPHLDPFTVTNLAVFSNLTGPHLWVLCQVMSYLANRANRDGGGHHGASAAPRKALASSSFESAPIEEQVGSATSAMF